MNGRVLAKYVKYGLGAYVCISLSYPRNKSSYVFLISHHTKIKAVGRGGRPQTTGTGGKVKKVLSQP